MRNLQNLELINIMNVNTVVIYYLKIFLLTQQKISNLTTQIK